MIVGELRDHHVIGVEFVFHHPLALENLLIHCFESCLHAASPPRSLNIMDVQHPLTHLNGLRVLQHLRGVRIYDLLEKLVLGALGDVMAI